MKDISKYIYPAIISVTFLYILYFFYYKEGTLVMGGEGSYFTDFLMVLKNYGYLWYNSAVGFGAVYFNFIFHPILAQLLFNSQRLTNFINIAILYILPFLAIYILSLSFKIKPFIASLIAIFYVVNPFTVYFLYSINLLNMLAVYILPANFFIIYKFYHRPKVLFFLFGLHSLIFNFTNANPPTMVIYQIAIPISIFLISLYLHKKIILKDILSRYFLVFFSFLLFNFYALINTLYALSDLNSAYTTKFALSWLKNASHVPFLWKTFSLYSLISFPFDPNYNYFSLIYGSWWAKVLFLLPLLIIIISLLKKNLSHLHLKVLLLLLFFTGLLAKGVNPPFGKLYELAITHLPLFKIFKTAPEKWGVLFIFLLTLYFIWIIKQSNKSSLFFKFTLASLIIITAYSSIPFVKGKFLPDYKYNGSFTGSKHFFYKQEYKQLLHKLNSDPLQYRVLSLPGHLNYQIALRIDGKRFYGGNDPILNNSNKPFIAPYNNFFTAKFDVIFKNLSSPYLAKILSLYNIKKIIINKDMYPWFGFINKETNQELEEIFTPQFSSNKNNIIDTYDIGQAFLPRIYIADQIIKTNLTIDDLPKVFADNDISVRPAIFLKTPKIPDQKPSQIQIDPQNLPQLAFKKINPTKYQLKFRSASKPFLLVFSENFHRGWKLYPSSPKLSKNLKVIASYLNGDVKEMEAEQKYFDRYFYSTWALKPANTEHYLINGYANAWIIDPADFAGRQEFELTLEYWPQRLFYIGFAVTLITLLFSLFLVIKLKFKKQSK